MGHYMEHYSRGDWEAFARGEAEENKENEMEKHLSVCDLCLHEYLSCFPEERIKAAERELRPQFVSNVMKRVSDFETRKKRSWQRQQGILYYTAAACLTLFFVSAGVFDGFAGILPKIIKPHMSTKVSLWADRQDLIGFGWSDELMDSTLTFIDTIKPKDREVKD